MHYTIQFDRSKPDSRAERERQALEACKDYLGLRFPEIILRLQDYLQKPGSRRTAKYRAVCVALSFAGIQGYWVCRAMIREANRGLC
jgi:hypothetical protein